MTFHHIPIRKLEGALGLEVHQHGIRSLCPLFLPWGPGRAEFIEGDLLASPRLHPLSPRRRQKRDAGNETDWAQLAASKMKWHG